MNSKFLFLFVLAAFIWSGGQKVWAEVSDSYSLAVQEFLNGNDEAAILRLKETLKEDSSNEKAKRLLLKAYMRAIRVCYEKKDYPKAHRLIREAKTYFPTVPEIKVLYSSMEESFPMKPPRPLKEKPRTEKKQQQTVHVEKAPVPIVVTVPAPMPPARTEHRRMWVVTIFTLLGLSGVFLYAMQRSRKYWSGQIQSMQETLQQQESERVDLAKNLESLKKTVQERKSPPLLSAGALKIPKPQMPKQEKEPAREEVLDRVAAQAVELYQSAPQEALRFLKELAQDKDPVKRACLVPVLVKIGASEVLDILFKLLEDPDFEVKREVLKCFTALSLNENSHPILKDESTSPPVPEAYRQKMRECLVQEKNKGEWVL